MPFDQALKMMRQGHTLTRTHWSDPRRAVELKNDNHFTRSEPYQDSRVTMVYHPTVTDVLASDWELVR